jgi:hypothetical protein
VMNTVLPGDQAGSAVVLAADARLAADGGEQLFEMFVVSMSRPAASAPNSVARIRSKAPGVPAR